jgi:hypothetical protein
VCDDLFRVHRRAVKPDKVNFKRKNEFGSFANANFNGGMYSQCWTMIDKPESIQKL